MKTVIGVLLLVVAVGLQFKTIAVFRCMKADVNGVLPPEARIPDFGPSWLRGKVIKLHRKHFPDSGLRKALYGFWFAMLVAFLSAVGSVVTFK